MIKNGTVIGTCAIIVAVFKGHVAQMQDTSNECVYRQLVRLRHAHVRHCVISQLKVRYVIQLNIS